jgi:putative membrane protein
MTLERIQRNPQWLIGFLILFYAVGVLLFLVEKTRPLFSLLTPFSLILTFGAVLLFQKNMSGKLVMAFIAVCIATFIIEMAGVHTGVLFGNYVYGNALGKKILDTPILIGLNWLILTYCTTAIVNYHFSGRIQRMLMGSVMMVAYDVLLEYVAPVTDMWSWDTPYPGIRNFLMWFIIAMVLHFVFQILDLKIENKPARYLFLVQLLFFGIIVLSDVWIL